MYRVQNRVGRLVEISIWSPVSLDEAIRWGRDHASVINAVHGAYVCFVDLRRASVFPPDVVDAYVSTMSDEPRLDRTATLLPTNATVALQIGRMIREAGHPGRRAFDRGDALAEWLAPHLDAEERSRLRALLDAPRPRAG
jgi:hypothetical protein